MLTEQTGNHFLDSFSEPLRGALLRASSPVDLPQRTTLWQAEHVPTHLHFLTEGLASVVVTMSEEGSAEVAMTGCEALTGAHFLLAPQPSLARCFMQVTGSGIRVPLRFLQYLFDTSEEFRRSVLAQVRASLAISMQSTACGLLHEAEARLARWLLMVSDRTETDSLPLTQEFLAEMLGTQRTTVAVVAGALRRAGLIDYRRGKVHIVDREGLTEAACECYHVMRRSMERIPSERENLVPV